MQPQTRPEAYAQWLRDRMLERGWSQKDVTVHSGVGQNMVSNILNGRVSRMTANQIVGLARAFDMSPTELLEQLGYWKSPGMRRVAEQPIELEDHDLLGAACSGLRPSIRATDVRGCVNAIPVRVAEAVDGYLMPPGQHSRHILDLGPIIERALAGDASLYWSGDLPAGCYGYSHCTRRRMFFRPELVSQPPWLIRDCVSHELGHVILGSVSCEWVREWQLSTFGPLIQPEPVSC